MTDPILEISGLTLGAGDTHPVEDLHLSINRGEFMALVGPSGCGKTLSALSVLRLLPPSVRVQSGQILFEGTDLMSLPEKNLRKIRGSRAAMIFQEPMTSLNPVISIGAQLREAITLHLGLSGKAAKERAVRALADVKVPDPDLRLASYPHQLSGGLRQRVMIAMALACRPSFLIADEPTTALDVTVQAGIMNLLASIRQTHNLSILLITHDIALAAEVTDRIAVMENGRIVEIGETADIINNPQHDCTRRLIEQCRIREQEAVS